MQTVFELYGVNLERVRDLYDSVPADRAYIASALSGESPARVFVDHPERPTAAMIARTYEYFLGGAIGTALDQFIVDAPPEVGIWADFYGFVAADDSWNAHLPSLVPTLERIGRRTFRIDSPDQGFAGAWSANVPDDVAIVPLTRALAEQADREMPEIIAMFWSGYERYAERGFGAVALVEGRPVSIAYTVAVGGGEANVGVLTVEAHRRRGLAAMCSRAWIEQCLERRLTPTWDCDEINPASAALALSLGFIEATPFVEWANPGRGERIGPAGVWSRTNQGEAVSWSRE